MSVGVFPVTGLDGQVIELDRATVDRFAAGVQGPVLREGDEGFDDATRIWNGLVSKSPALVVQPTRTDDIVRSVRFATDEGLLLSIKGGGHNIAGSALAQGGLTLDMSRLRTVRVTAPEGPVRVGPGCLLQDVDRETQQHGLATVLGFVSETGAAGLTLGGGYGYLTRRFGWTVDNLEELQIVTADGEILRASRSEHPDLFWALRGGGGNFGVVTEFTYRTHQVGPGITGGLFAWSAEEAEDVLAVFREVCDQGPRALTLAVTMRLAPPAPFVPAAWHGKPIIAVVVCHTGDPATVSGDLAPMRAVGHPIVDLVRETTYVQQQKMLDATQPKGLHYYWKSEFLPGLPDGLLETYREQAGAIASPLSQMFLFHIGGVLNERADDDGAVGNRDAAYVLGAAGGWRPDDHRAAEHHNWVRTAWEAVLPHSTGGNYVNFQTEEEGDDRARAAYGANFQRLGEVKAAYDPYNVFRLNRNIRPAGTTAAP